MGELSGRDDFLVTAASLPAASMPAKRSQSAARGGTPWDGHGLHMGRFSAVMRR
jgi:hypothetical protein